MAEQQNREDLDRAYRAALAQPADAAEQAGQARRKRALLAALDAEPARPAQAARVASGGAWWRGAAAASVLVASSLLVLHLRDEPDAAVPAPSRADTTAGQQPVAERAAEAVPQAVPQAVLPAATATQAASAASPRPRAVSAAAPASTRPDMTTPLSDKADAAAAPSMAAAPIAQNAPDQMLRAEPAAPLGNTAAGGAKAARLASKPASERSPGPAGAPPGSLLEAVAQNKLAAAERLLAEISPDDERDGEGRTPLAVAVMRADIPMIKLLLARGARPEIADRNGETALDRARSSGNKAVLQAFGLP